MATYANPNRTSFVDAPLKRDLVTSVLTGQIAGLVMAIALVAVFVFYLGKPFYFPVQVIGSFITGDAAVTQGFHAPSFVAGLALHQLVGSVAWSLVFAFLMHRLEHSTLNILAVGLTVGVVSQVVDVTFLVPAVMNAAHGHNLWAENVPAAWSWIAHLVFGASFLFFNPVNRALPEA